MWISLFKSKSISYPAKNPVYAPSLLPLTYPWVSCIRPFSPPPNLSLSIELIKNEGWSHESKIDQFKNQGIWGDWTIGWMVDMLTKKIKGLGI